MRDIALLIRGIRAANVVLAQLLRWLPNKTGRFAIAVYMKCSTANDVMRERVIANFARAAFDEWG